MVQSIYGLHEIATQANILPVSKVAAMPGVRLVYRVTVQHKQFDLANTVLTMRCMRSGEAIIETVYQGLFENRPLIRHLSSREFDSFSQALYNMRFDRLQDQPNIPFYGVDLWFIERASGGFEKNLVLSPDTAADTYARLIALFRAYCPELIRRMER